VVLIVEGASAVDVKIDFDKEFIFKNVRTWAWNPAGPGEVKMARTPDDNPEALQKEAEPVILSAVAEEMGRRRMQQSDERPDLLVTYYLLLTLGDSAQTIGQFVPGPMQWGIPPYVPSTQSLEVMNQGSLVLDLKANDEIVWRGVARANVRIGTDSKRRVALLREAVRDLLRRFPPRS
jgi:hypothetical protein